MRREFVYKFNIVAVIRTGLTYYDDDGNMIGPVCKTLRVISTDDYDELRKLVDETKDELYAYDVEFFDAGNGEGAIMNDKEKKLESNKTRGFDGRTIRQYRFD